MEEFFVHSRVWVSEANSCLAGKGLSGLRRLWVGAGIGQFVESCILGLPALVGPLFQGFGLICIEFLSVACDRHGQRFDMNPGDFAIAAQELPERRRVVRLANSNV